jgi:UDP-N-acetylglucosamine--N-acetylmuramyl-(pentapeptide) pyrophosphoryl-undecaprenol N-acetylglucosamine transferase
MKKTVVFTGGGTAGHVYPGLSVAESLTGRDSEIKIIWIGSSAGMEKKLVQAAGIDYTGIPSGKLRRYFSLKNFTDLFKIKAGFIKAFFILRKLRPVLVFSKGGFVSVPPVVAAGLLKIPVISHESDLTPGLATRINIRFSQKVLTAFKETLSFLPAGKAEFTGNPVRASIYAANPENGRQLAAAGDKKIILVLGGSQGALQINQLVEAIAEKLTGKYVLVHQMGSFSFKESTLPGYITRDYINDELPDFMAAADIIISRAGASTLWEIAALKKPSVLIPLGTGSSRGDQIKNAGGFSKAGAAVSLEGDITSDILYSEIIRLLNDEEMLKRMGLAAGQMVEKNPAERIADIILKGLE